MQELYPAHSSEEPQGKRFRRTDAPQALQKGDEAQAPVRAKRTRRPGDRAGMKAQSASQSASQNASGSNGAPNAASRDAQSQNAARRRHRRAGRDDRGRGSKDNA